MCIMVFAFMNLSFLYWVVIISLRNTLCRASLCNNTIMSLFSIKFHSRDINAQSNSRMGCPSGFAALLRLVMAVDISQHRSLIRSSPPFALQWCPVAGSIL